MAHCDSSLREQINGDIQSELTHRLISLSFSLSLLSRLRLRLVLKKYLCCSVSREKRNEQIIVLIFSLSIWIDSDGEASELIFLDACQCMRVCNVFILVLILSAMYSFPSSILVSSLSLSTCSIYILIHIHIYIHLFFSFSSSCRTLVVVCVLILYSNIRCLLLLSRQYAFM